MKVYEYVKILFKKSIYSIFKRITKQKRQLNHHFKMLSLRQQNFISFTLFPYEILLKMY